MTRRTPAADQFKALGIPETDWTDAMQLAVKQKWSGLPVDDKVADLRAALEALTQPEVPTVEQIKGELVLAGNPVVTDDMATAEHKRRKRNAAVNHWRARNQIQAALDAREAKFAMMRGKRKGGGKDSQSAPLAAAS